MNWCKWFGHKDILVESVEIRGIFNQGGTYSRYRCTRCGREEGSRTDTLKMSGTVKEVAETLAKAVRYTIDTTKLEREGK